MLQLNVDIKMQKKKLSLSDKIHLLSWNRQKICFHSVETEKGPSRPSSVVTPRHLQ